MCERWHGWRGVPGCEPGRHPSTNGETMKAIPIEPGVRFIHDSGWNTEAISNPGKIYMIASRYSEIDWEVYFILACSCYKITNMARVYLPSTMLEHIRTCQAFK